MVPTLLLAATLAAASPASASALAARPGVLRLQGWDGYADDEDGWEEGDDEEEDERGERVLLSAWAGGALAGGGAGRSSAFFAGEAAWALDSVDLGISYAGYRSLRDATRTWTPVVLTRVTQRFRTRRGFDAAFSLGLGAGNPDGWIGWFQVALGVRVPLGPLFLGGELAFEQYDIIRLGGGLGVAF